MWGFIALVLGEYLVGSPADFQQLSSVTDTYIRLAADLDFSGVTDYVPQTFSGTLDGGNRTISNLVIS